MDDNNNDPYLGGLASTAFQSAARPVGKPEPVSISGQYSTLERIENALRLGF